MGGTVHNHQEAFNCASDSSKEPQHGNEKVPVRLNFDLSLSFSSDTEILARGSDPNGRSWLMNWTQDLPLLQWSNPMNCTEWHSQWHWHWQIPVWTLPDISYCFLIHPIDKTEWDISRFADRVKNTKPTANIDESLEDARLAKFFENPQFGYFEDPATILDRHGRIMMWILPRILSPYRVVSFPFI